MATTDTAEPGRSLLHAHFSAAFIAYVRHPAPSGMPVFTPKVISDADLTDIWTYLKSIPEPPAVKDIPLLNQ